MIYVLGHCVICGPQRSSYPLLLVSSTLSKEVRCDSSVLLHLISRLFVLGITWIRKHQTQILDESPVTHFDLAQTLKGPLYCIESRVDDLKRVFGCCKAIRKIPKVANSYRRSVAKSDRQHVFAPHTDWSELYLDTAGAVVAVA